MKTERNIIGIMSGTSLDGIDAAMVKVDGNGLDIVVTPIRHSSCPLGAAADTLRAMAHDEPVTASMWAQARVEFSKQCARVANACAAGTSVDLVVVHGQTVHHAPPASIQLINAAVIAQQTGSQVMHDLRAADLAAGGQGAPITPLADWILFRDAEPVTVVNLGGFCNFTSLPSDRNDARDINMIEAGDVCTCNQLLDQAARSLLDLDMDPEGLHAARGQSDTGVARMIADRLRKQSKQKRSLGSGDEARDVLELLDCIVKPEDALATLVEAVATAITASLPGGEQRLLLAGGGVFNQPLADTIADRWAGQVAPTSSRGIGVEAREAVCMAILGALAMDGMPITLPQVTGRGERIAADGCLTPIAIRND